MLSRNCNVEQPSLCHWKIWEGEGCYEAEPEELPEYNAVMPAMDRKRLRLSISVPFYCLSRKVILF